jgi:hypothetical protein
MTNSPTIRRLAVSLGALVLAGTLAWSASAASGQDEIGSMVIVAQQDAHISADVATTDDPQGLRDKNYGSQQFLAISYSNKVQGNEQTVSVALTKFDTAPVKDLTVQSATLQLFAQRADLNQPVRLVDVSAVQGDWSEANLTFNNKPAWSATPLSTAAVYGGGLWYSWDVTSTVAGATGGTVSYVLGLRTLEDGKAEQVLFASHEASGANAPRLVVTYSVQASGTPAWEVAGGATAATALLLIGGFLLVTRFRRSVRKRSAAVTNPGSAPDAGSVSAPPE